MLKTLRDAFKIKDIRNRILFTFGMLVVIRFGSQLPTPGVNGSLIQNFFEQNGSELFNFFDAFTGGSFSKMSVFALSITPYITSSIIIQLLTIAIPKLEEMQKEGEEGRKKLVAITRYVTIILSLIESIAMAVAFGRQGYLSEYNFVNCAIIVVTLTAGSAFLMWIGERITENGVGNGISIVLLINIVSRMPSDFVTLYQKFVEPKITAKTYASAGLSALIIIAVVVVTIVFVIILQDGERRIAVQYSKKLQGRRMVGGQSTYIPVKVNTGGVIPIIFAQSIMEFPVMIATFMGKGTDSYVMKMLSSNNWINPSHMEYSLGLVIYMVLVVFFAYFYTSITFNPMEIADNMKKSGGFIPGIRPGKPTVDYLSRILKYIIFMGAVGLIIVQLIPYFFNGVFGASVSFGGTSLIIVVGVVLETIKQIESQMLVRNYRGFLND